jgi:hypothetical protein
MSFTQAEFNRLDEKKDGKLEVQEPAQRPTKAFHKECLMRGLLCLGITVHHRNRLW